MRRTAVAFSLSLLALLTVGSLSLLADDPFGEENPFKEQADPFGGGADPFGNGADPFGNGANPVGGGPVEGGLGDPFGDNVPVAVPNDPFGLMQPAGKRAEQPQEAPAADPVGGADPFGGRNGADPFGGPKPAAPAKCAVRKKAPTKFSLAPLPQQAGGEPRPAAIDHLRRNIKITLDEQPLEEVVELLSTQTGIAFSVDHIALEEIGLGADSPVTVDIANGTSLENAIWLMLRQLEPHLTIVTTSETVQITTWHKAERHPIRRVFPVGDLLRAPEPPLIRHVWRDKTRTSSERPADELIELVETNLSPEYWAPEGPSTVRHANGMLVASAHLAETHRGLEHLLKWLRKSKEWDGRDAALLNEIQHPVEHLAWDQLDVRGAFEFKDRPLKEVVDYLRFHYQQEIQIDRFALKEIGLYETSPVHVSLANGTVYQALHLILRGLDPDLTIMAMEDVLLITTVNVAEARLLSQVFPVMDLIRNEDQAHVLIDSLRTNVGPTSWNNLGGPGNIDYYAPAHALVVTQTFERLEAIGALLSEMRAHAAKNVAISDNEHDESTAAVSKVQADKDWPTVVYHCEIRGPGQIIIDLDAQTTWNIEGKPQSLEHLPGLIRSSTGEELWQVENAQLVLIANRLIVRHTPAVQRRVEKLLQDLDVLQAAPRPEKSGKGLPFDCGGTTCRGVTHQVLCAQE